MMDVRIIQDDLTKEYDIGIFNDDFILDRGLETSVLISLFSDGREEERETDKRGFWGAAVLDEDRNGAQFGSKLWLLMREKQIDETLVKIREWCDAALQWMIDEKIATRVNTAAEYLRMGTVLIQIEIERGTEEPLTFKFQYLWDGQFGV